MIDAPRVVAVASRPAAVIPFVIPRAEMPKVMGPAIQELLATLASQGIAPAGPVFAHHLRMPQGMFDFEVGVPVSSPVAAAGRVQPGELPSATVARTIYRGPYEGLPSAWGEFMAWIESEGHSPAPDLWEVYLTNPESTPDPADWRTELNRPLAE